MTDEIREFDFGPELQQEDELFVASQWQLIRWRFAKHKMAVASMIVLIIAYLFIILASFLGPYDPRENHSKFIYVPPQKVYFRSPEGSLSWPYVRSIKGVMDPMSLRITYTEDPGSMYPVGLFVPGAEYKILGLIPANVHLFGVSEGGTIFLLGTDKQGRDLFTRILYGGQISLSIGLVGIAITFFLGILVGGLAGYYGGMFDLISQRLVEIIQGVPKLPLWMVLSAALPLTWNVIQVYFAIIVILSLFGWTGLARVVRGKFLSLREEDFVMAARIGGANEVRIVFRHMVPSFASYLIASLTMSVPGMILGETSLSFLGLGLRPPAISWGVLLSEAQSISALAESPWLLLPGVPVIIIVLAYQFFGDGIRDAADPYSR